MSFNPPDTENPLTATENLEEGSIVVGAGYGMSTVGRPAKVDDVGSISLPDAATITWGAGDIVFTHTSNLLTMSGGKLAVSVVTGFSGNIFECFFNGVSAFRVAASGDIANPGSCSSTGGHVARSSTATPAGGGPPAFTMGASGPSFYWGSGNPLLAAVKGSYYSNTTATGPNDRLWVATDSTGGWTNLICAT